MEASENCSVKAAVHVRPLIADERQQGCREWVTVTPGKPQVQIGTHSFTFDHVYGSGGSPSSAIFEECIAPLVDGLFQGYNATVLAYGQTGSGKTYTMGTGSKDGRQTGLIPKVMNALFGKIQTFKKQTQFNMHVSFIEIFKEEVRDLLDSVSIGKSEASNGHAIKAASPGRPPIQIRETSDGVITLSGSTEVPVSTLQEMTACLEQGSLIRATGSTNMNSHSSRSHAIFTITLEQMHKLHTGLNGNDTQDEDMGEEYFCAKFHLVDLAGSERAKRTGSDGLRLKEGIHINKGLLALGNVISSLGDEKKQKEGVHVPYRDSKLTRLLQDSLGGNSRTVMIACISPADINAEESLNTLKYANRARNIQNKPIVNKDLLANEMQKMRQQVKLLQTELCARGDQSNEVQILKERITLLEATNEDLCRQLHEYRNRCAILEQHEIDSQVARVCSGRSDGLKRGFQRIGSFDRQISEIISSENSGEIDEVAKECEHALRRDTLDKEMIELNKQLKQKESEMKLVDGVDVEAIKQHFRKKILELKEEKRTMQKERDQLLAEVESLAANSDVKTHKTQDIYAQKLKALEAQILDLKKQENHVHIVKQKQKSDEDAQQLQAEIQYIKSQKVKLQHRIKQEAGQFRQWKASREKELLQLKKEGRKNEYERRKLQALNQRQKLVLQRKTTEATMATKRLKELLEARKSAARDNSGHSNGHAPSVQGNEKKIQRWLDHELEVMVKMHEVRFGHEKQSQVRAALQDELSLLKQVEQFSVSGKSPSKRKKGFSRVESLSPNTRMTRISSLENMLNMSSSTLMSMASQLSEAEDRDRAIAGRGRWNHLHSMGETKNLLQHLFSAAAESRCQLWEKEMEIKDTKEKVNELVILLQQSETQRKEVLKEQAILSASVPQQDDSHTSLEHCEDDINESSSPVSLPAPKQLKFTPGIVNAPIRDSGAFLNQTQKQRKWDPLANPGSYGDGKEAINSGFYSSSGSGRSHGSSQRGSSTVMRQLVN